MFDLYEFLTGTAVWLSFSVFIGGLVVRSVYLLGLSLERDRVVWNHINWKWGLRSIVHWLFPLGSVSLRAQPVFGVAFFVFHFCLFVVPLFLQAHNILLQKAFGISLPSLPESYSDILTVVFMVAGLVLLARRIIKPEVRILTTPWDYFLLVLSTLPFLTGFLAYHQISTYRIILILHILSAEVLLVLIPFTKLGHIVLFFFTRAFIGFEMGTRRGARTW